MPLDVESIHPETVSELENHQAETDDHVAYFARLGNLLEKHVTGLLRGLRVQPAHILLEASRDAVLQAISKGKTLAAQNIARGIVARLDSNPSLLIDFNATRDLPRLDAFIDRAHTQIQHESLTENAGRLPFKEYRNEARGGFAEHENGGYTNLDDSFSLPDSPHL